MLGNTSGLLGDVMTGIASNVKCGFDEEVAIRGVFTVWFCPRVQMLVLTRSGIGLGGQWFVTRWVSMLHRLVSHAEMSDIWKLQQLRVHVVVGVFFEVVVGEEPWYLGRIEGRVSLQP